MVNTKFDDALKIFVSGEKMVTQPPGSVISQSVFIVPFEAVAPQYYLHTYIGTFLQRLVLVLSLTTFTAAADLSRDCTWTFLLTMSIQHFFLIFSFILSVLQLLYANIGTFRI